MLDVNTLPKRYRKLKNLLTSMSSLLRSRSKKNRKKEELIFKTNALVPKKAVLRKEEGATVAASHLPSLRRNSAGWSRKGRTGRDSPRRFILQERPIKYHKCPTFDTKRETRFSEFTDWPSKTDETNETKRCS